MNKYSPHDNINDIKVLNDFKDIRDIKDFFLLRQTYCLPQKPYTITGMIRAT